VQSLQARLSIHANGPSEDSAEDPRVCVRRILGEFSIMRALAVSLPGRERTTAIAFVGLDPGGTGRYRLYCKGYLSIRDRKRAMAAG